MVDKQRALEPDLGDVVSAAVEFTPASMKQRELALLRNPQLKYLPAYILKDTESFFAKYEKMAPEKRKELVRGYKMLQDFIRRFSKAGGKIHSGSDPNHVVAGYGVHAELEMLVEAGLTPAQAIQTAALNVAQAWGKDKEYGSVEKGKVADFCYRARRSAEKYFRHAERRNGVYGRQEDGHVVSRGLQEPDPAADRRSAGGRVRYAAIR